MLHFSPVTIDDRETIQAFFYKSVFRNCDFSFSNIFNWKHLYNTTFVVEEGFLYFRFQTLEDLPGYLFPLGEGNLQQAIERMLQDAEDRGVEFRLYSITQKMFDLIEQCMPGQFIFTTERDWFEYIYLSDDLISLAGKKYQAKRNHIHKFKRTYQWEYLPITRDIVPDCMRLYDRWCKEHGGCYTEQSLIEERIATQKAFEYYEPLGLIGGALRINGEILAYSYGQALTKDTFGVHAEKSLYDIDGGFTMINQQFAEHNCADYLYINREEDLGIEPLRQAKTSYHPAILLEKGLVRKKDS
ncbi:MAG: phosphatidylglycerol lysyltransferase domain-containing protein [Candidatus Azobacteroides sp.]|nr:phosphatidylglycerol lysyltransferase domain-containing protein [Candidatus Azobacteroides sp.]